MSNEYPDVLGDLVSARERFEVNGIHYQLALQPQVIAPGATTSLWLWLQSCWDVPAVVSVTIPLTSNASSPLSVLQIQTDIPLEAAEVGTVTIPIKCAIDTPVNSCPVPIYLKASTRTRGTYVRSQKTRGHFANSLLHHTTGMALAQTLGLGFVATSQEEQQLRLTVQGAAQPEPEPDLTPTFVSQWTVQDLAIQGQARQLVNDKRLYIQPRINRRALYSAFLQESQSRYQDADLALHIGEAIALARILTFAVEYFLEHPDWQDVILVPAFCLAYRYDLVKSDPVALIARADYARITRLAIALSFGLLAKHLAKELWSMDEEIAVAKLVAGLVDQGGHLPAEFLYLPLILGSILVNDQVTMPGENLNQSMTLLAQARAQRQDDLAHNNELVQILDHLLGSHQIAS